MAVQADLERVLEALKRSGELLKTPRPDLLEDSAAGLEAACRDLERVGRAVRAGGGGDGLAAAKDLQRALARSTKLLQTAFDYHAQWAEWKGILAGGYDRGGRAAEYIARGSLSVRG